MVFVGSGAMGWVGGAGMDGVERGFWRGGGRCVGCSYGFCGFADTDWKGGCVERSFWYFWKSERNGIECGSEAVRGRGGGGRGCGICSDGLERLV